MNKAIFLDRDGVINEERGDYTYRVRDFVFVEGLTEALKELQSRGYKLIIVSNQSGIAKGIYGHREARALHQHTTGILAREGINVEAVYYCPHHPDHGKCLCRKPGSLMIEKALARFNIDPARSYMIGDKDRDIAAAEKVGVKGIKVVANSPMKKVLHLID